MVGELRGAAGAAVGKGPREDDSNDVSLETRLLSLKLPKSKHLLGKAAQVDTTARPRVESACVSTANCLKAHSFQDVGFKYQPAPLQLGLTLEELKALAVELGEKPFR